MKYFTYIKKLSKKLIKKYLVDIQIYRNVMADKCYLLLVQISHDKIVVISVVTDVSTLNQ